MLFYEQAIRENSFFSAKFPTCLDVGHTGKPNRMIKTISKTDPINKKVIIIGRYTVLKELESGGYSKVIEAQDSLVVLIPFLDGINF